MESSPSGSSRRTRPPVIGSSAPSCMVDGCSADLGQCRDYHRRHKVCEFHAKMPIVYVKGQEQRFCQQCSRFHSLVEFDNGKRSCRKRLEGHNLRRRKPRRDFVPVNVSRLYTSSQGTRYIHFGAPQIPLGPAISEPLISRSSREMFFDGLNRVVDSDCSHSLLSSPPAKTQEINMVRPELISSQNYSWTRVETRPVGSVLVSDSRNVSLPGPNRFHVHPDGTSATGSQPTLPFSWE